MQTKSKKLLSIILSIAMLLSITAGLDFSVEAATYSKIANLRVPRFYQDVVNGSGDGSCNIAAVASAAMYARGNSYNNKSYYYGNDYSHSDAWFKYCLSNNGNSYAVSSNLLSKLNFTGYDTAYNLSNMYNALKAGKPVVVYRDNVHASVVIGYNANTSSLSTDNFIVMEVSKAAANDTSKTVKSGWGSCYITLSGWISRIGKPTRMYYPKSVTSPEPAAVKAASTSITLDLNGTKSKSVNITASGNLPSSYKFNVKSNNSNVEYSWGSWSGNTCPLTIKGLHRGSTHPAIIDKETFDIVQRIRDKRRRPTKSGRTSLFNGLLYCADCGSRMTFNATVKNGYPNFICANYRKDTSNCTSHYIRDDALYDIVLESMQRVLWYVQAYDKGFAQMLIEKENIEQKNELQKKQKALNKAISRVSELDLMIQRLYEDNVLGKITDERFTALSKSFELEQKQLKADIPIMQEELNTHIDKSQGLQKFINKAKRLTHLTELTPEILHEFVEKIVVSAPTKVNGKRYQNIDIYYSGVGLIKEPTPEQMEQYFEKTILKEHKQKTA